MAEIVIGGGAGRRQVRARLRPLTGADEAMLDGEDPAAATTLLKRLLVGGDGRLEPSEVDALTVSEHDRLLARLFDALYGDRVEARSTCIECGQGMEIYFSLASLAAAPPETEAPIVGPQPDGSFWLDDGRRFRPPVIAELAAAASMGEAEGLAALRRACVLEGDPEGDPALLDAALDVAAPALARDVVAACPDCGASQSVRFDLARFLVAALLRERGFLLRETHLLATTYGWSLAEILGLSRADRRTLARFCAAEDGAGQRRAA
jgi:hypothetical protein